MSLRKLAKKLVKGNDVDLEKEFELLKRRQKDIEINGYFTAMIMDKIRQDEFQACKKHEWEEENNKLGGNEDENC